MIVLIRGGGDLASGVALRLHRAGLQVVVTELPSPLALRRMVSFSEAVYVGESEVEGITARRVSDPSDRQRVLQVLSEGHIPVLVDPQGEAVTAMQPSVLVDARMVKRYVEQQHDGVKLLIGLGPGFVPGENCHAVVETNRGHMLGRVLWDSASQADTGIPDTIANYQAERVLRAPAGGLLQAHAEIGDQLEGGQLIAEVNGHPVYAPFKGVLRGLVHPGLEVHSGLKIGDVDPRDDPRYCRLVSDKSLTIGGGVLEAILCQPDLRAQLWK